MIGLRTALARSGETMSSIFDRARDLVAIACAAAISLAPANQAQACLNEYARVYLLPRAVRTAERIESALAEGNARAAARDAIELYQAVQGEAYQSSDWVEDGELYGDAPEMGDSYGVEADAAETSALRRRAEVLYAVSVARVDGQITRANRLARRVSPSIRAEALAKAMDAIGTPLATNPREVAYHAELLSVAEPSRANEAKRALEDLARRDLLTDPFSYRALAVLTTDTTRRAELVTRCETMASRRGARACAVR